MLIAFPQVSHSPGQQLRPRNRIESKRTISWRFIGATSASTYLAAKLARCTCKQRPQTQLRRCATFRPKAVRTPSPPRSSSDFEDKAQSTFPSRARSEDRGRDRKKASSLKRVPQDKQSRDFKGAKAPEGPSLSAKERFEQRMQLWATMRERGHLSHHRQVINLVRHEDETEESQTENEERVKAKLLAAAEESDDKFIATQVQNLWGNPWSFGVRCLIGMGSFQLAKEAVMNGLERGVEESSWWRTAVALSDAAMVIKADTNDVTDRATAQDILRLLMERGHHEGAFEVLSEFALADAQRGANLLLRNMELRKERKLQRNQTGEVNAEEEEKVAIIQADRAKDADILFDSALQKMREAADQGVAWGVKFEVAVFRGSAHKSIVSRWNDIIRFISKRRRMPDIFEALRCMTRTRVDTDSETYEFIARAAVANVRLSALVDSFQTMPPPTHPEVVFLGWSNVGKSSLVNCLLHRKALAPVSTMPGKTTQFHFYALNETHAAFPRMTIVDVPGLGAAMAEEEQTRHWKRTLLRYLKERGKMLRMIFHLISCEVLKVKGRPSALDMDIMRMAKKLKAEYTVVITKTDLIKSREDLRLIMSRMSDLVPQMGPRARVIASSVKATIKGGRDHLWQRLWTAVDPNDERNQIILGPTKLADLKAEMDKVVAAGDAAKLVAMAQDATEDDVWEYAVRCLLRLGNLSEAWCLVRLASGLATEQDADTVFQFSRDAGPSSDLDDDSIATGEELDGADIPDREEMMTEFMTGLEEALEANLLEAESEKVKGNVKEEEMVEENAESYDEASLAATEEQDGGSNGQRRRLSALQERAALAVGVSALAEGDSLTGVALNADLAQEVLDILCDHSSHGAAVELMLEQAVALAREAALQARSSSSTVFDKLRIQLEEVVAKAKMWDQRPWSADRWGRLVQFVGKRRELHSMDMVLDAMRACGVKANEEIKQIMAEMVIHSIDIADEASNPCLLNQKLLATSELPEVVFLGSSGINERTGASSVVASLMSALPRRRPEEELDSFSGSTVSYTTTSRKGKAKSTAKDNARNTVSQAQLLRLNLNADGTAIEAAAMPPVAIINVPSVQRPSATALLKAHAEVAAMGGAWGTASDAEEQVQTVANRWQNNVLSYLSDAKSKPFRGIFHVVDCRDFVQAIRKEVPSHATYRSRSKVLANAKPNDGICLNADDLAIQDAALRAKPEHYVLVAADSSVLGLETRRTRTLHRFFVATPIVMKRREVLVESLRLQAERTLGAISDKNAALKPQISIFLADQEHFADTSQLWRLLWACAVPESARPEMDVSTDLE